MAPRATERFREAAAVVGLDAEIVRFPEDTRTAEQAASAIGCELGQIVKSLVFCIGDEIVLVLTSGANRVDEVTVAPLFGADRLDRADPEAVRSATGFAIGGVPPCGHPARLRAVIDRDLMGWDTIWAAAGAPDSVFELTPAELQRVTEGTVAVVTA